MPRDRNNEDRYARTRGSALAFARIASFSVGALEGRAREVGAAKVGALICEERARVNSPS